MEIVGVEAVVEGLSTFISGMASIKGAVDGISPSATVLGQVFEGLGNVMGGVANFAENVLANALGFILRDAIEGTIALIGSLIGKMIEAGNQFQMLTIRLQGINMNMPSDGVDNFTASLGEAQKATQDEISWIQQMAIITPFNATNIGSVYTMQRAMGDSDLQARDLTTSITNWAAGMGLGNDSVLRLSDAMAKMTSSGKVNGLTFRQLRAEYVPIPEVLQQMQKDLGLTDAEFAKMQKDGTLAPEPFIQAFEEVANTRFPDAANKVAHTWQGAMDNIQDIFANIGGADIVQPVLDVLGNFVGSLVDIFAVMGPSGPILTGLGSSIITMAKGIGSAVSEIVSGILGLAPSAEDIGTFILTSMEHIFTWLEDNKQGIIDDFHAMFDWIISVANSDFVQGIIGNLQRLSGELFNLKQQTGKTTDVGGSPDTSTGQGAAADWQKKNASKETTTGIADLAGAFGNLAGAIASVVTALLPGINLPKGDGVLQLTAALNGMAEWIKANRELLEFLIGVFVALLVIQFVVAVIFSLAVAFVATAVAIQVFVVIALLIGVVMAAIGVVILTAITIIKNLQLIFIVLGGVVAFVVAFIALRIAHLQEIFTTAIVQIKDAWAKQDWGAIGTAVIEGIAKGITSAIADLVDAATTAATAAIEAAKKALGVQSPSKVFHEIGSNVMKGMAEGIGASTSAAVAAMQDAVSAVTMPAMNAPSIMQQYSQAAPSSISNTYQRADAYNLHIHTSAKHESIVQDFRTLQSLSTV